MPQITVPLDFNTIEEALAYYNMALEEEGTSEIEATFEDFIEELPTITPAYNPFSVAFEGGTISDDTPMFSIRHSDVAEHYGKKENEGLKSIVAKYSETNINY
jgi:hypothetical protein